VTVLAAHPIRNAFLFLLVLIGVAVLAVLPYALARVDDPSLQPAVGADAAAPAPSLGRVPPVATRRALFGDLHVQGPSSTAPAIRSGCADRSTSSP
jgi:hypothetical protein